jgi:hypothetical protein
MDARCGYKCANVREKTHDDYTIPHRSMPHCFRAVPRKPFLHEHDTDVIFRESEGQSPVQLEDIDIFIDIYIWNSPVICRCLYRRPWCGHQIPSVGI